jgi:hypothetical protein
MFDRINEHPLTWFVMGLWLGWLAHGDLMRGFLTQ